MAVVTTKSLSITNLDSTPIVAMPVGEGATGAQRVSNDSVASASGDSIASIYRCVRVPTNAKIKKVILNSTTGAGGAGAGDIDVAFSDAPDLPAPYQPLAGTIVQITGPADNKLFGAAVSLISPQTQVDVTFKNTFTLANQNQPLWQVLANLGCTQFNNPAGAPQDPGGFFDIVVKLTTAITVAGGLVGLEVDYVE